ncbi:hypothetical protein MesoLjLc_60370 [Mesorhizobium sp. L-8-10]|uniref:hypothetical protein n=1 Tax=unclassified Mesorhizobium TaxID=325217 RepID=UPI001926049D|nr:MULTISPECIES: hypothetical protein [unclassified Mesorhizobium]BCH26122.1 hypothetical protein MesoLjLb_59070 [Mesorhizobium sp. L-8-3]BCH34107.1 hypothetical protein MesoLjLc_60370 [Mesorhizobium sp. L-8-10]
MDATSEVRRTAVPVKLPAVAAGVSFAIEMRENIQPAAEDPDPSTLGELLSEIDLTPSQFEDALPDLPDLEDFEESVRMALAAVGGELLFQMRLENVDDCRHVAAVTLGTGGDRRVALVILPPEGVMRIEPVESSTNPLAALARSYAGVLDAYQSAA